MKTTYQPFILKLTEEVFEDLKDDINPSEASKKYLCDLLTEKFIDGKLSAGNRTTEIFESEDEIETFIKQCWVNDNLDNLLERGLIGTFDDDDTFFITEEGKKYIEQTSNQL